MKKQIQAILSAFMVLGMGSSDVKHYQGPTMIDAVEVVEG